MIKRLIQEFRKQHRKYVRELTCYLAHSLGMCVFKHIFVKQEGTHDLCNACSTSMCDDAHTLKYHTLHGRKEMERLLGYPFRI